MMNYLSALYEQLPMIMTLAVILSLLIGVPYQIEKALCRLETECEYDV